MYFNTLNNLFSKKINISTKILCLFDILRQTFIYYRYFVTALFIKDLILNTTVEKLPYLIPFRCFVMFPYIYFILVPCLYVP